MAKNILIFSDGTGQAGGLIPDEVETNVYKLYRATRCGPMSHIDPNEQVAFYDPGLGSPADGGGMALGLDRRIYNYFSQGTGFGLTRNIIDCYAAILHFYEPGDRIYLFGFSRGAYTARCVGGVLSLCGVPTRDENGNPILRDPKSVRQLAEKAVKKVYLYGNGWTALRFADQRKQIAQKFRMTYGSDDNGQSNIVPFFIGVWDTVSAVGASWNVVAVASGILAAVLFSYATFAHFVGAWSWLAIIMAPILIALLAVIFFLLLHFRSSMETTYSWFKTWHLNIWKVTFHDTKLNPRVQFAKHAQSIDENRKDFARVPWDPEGLRDLTTGWFEQVWFAGIHADVGGGYLENEARLSDISLQWMVDRAASTPFPVKVEPRFLSLYPSFSGTQHDERKAGGIPWTFGLRTILADARLHPTVIERFKLPGVMIFDQIKPYRPKSLRYHNDVKQYYN